MQDTPDSGINGILVYQQIRQLIADGFLESNPDISDHQIQPSSLDLRLATRGYRVRSGFLPENCMVADRLEEMTLYTFDLTDGSVLAPPAEAGVGSYRVEVDGGIIKVELP